MFTWIIHWEERKEEEKRRRCRSEVQHVYEKKSPRASSCGFENVKMLSNWNWITKICGFLRVWLADGKRMCNYISWRSVYTICVLQLLMMYPRFIYSPFKNDHIKNMMSSSTIFTLAYISHFKWKKKTKQTIIVITIQICFECNFEIPSHIQNFQKLLFLI